MLVIEVSRIPPEGMRVDAPLEAEALHLGAGESFSLAAGGRLACQVERGDDLTVHVRGHLSAGLEMECGGCLDAFTLPIEQDLDLFYLPHQPGGEAEDEDEITERDLVVAFYDEGRLDLGEMVREQLFLAVPMRRYCREDCRGICPTCGTNRNTSPCACPPPAVALTPFSTILKDPSS
jgi:DUF177 domain-containing protein